MKTVHVVRQAVITVTLISDAASIAAIEAPPARRRVSYRSSMHLRKSCRKAHTSLYFFPVQVISVSDKLTCTVARGAVAVITDVHLVNSELHVFEMARLPVEDVLVYIAAFSSIEALWRLFKPGEQRLQYCSRRLCICHPL